jgi:asparagine synthase (glutamine-hydrolysing)
MCGFAGAFEMGCREERWQERLEAMAAALAHRGPDDQGVWFDAQAGIGFGHRRLAVIDLTAAGHQPMQSASGRYVIAYNGEVYNFEQLRSELPGPWRGHSDTEVMLAAIEAWGLASAVERFAGMFALALWDRQERTLSLVRDRMGIKPLYYGWGRGCFLFGSELKALRIHPAFRSDLNRDAIAALMRFNYVPSPHSIYTGTHKLEPGRILRVPLEAVTDPTRIDETCFWSFKDVAERGQQQLFAGDDDGAVTRLGELLSQAVGDRMVSDVPLGAFLSGGLDSSLVVALMQAQSARPVKTFTIGFEEEGYNEANFAAEIARHLGTEHTELYVRPEDALAVIPELPRMFDEPFADSSQIPTFLISRLTRQHVTVSLSGDGGDELFGGYRRYAAARDLWRKARLLPRWCRRLTAATINATPTPLLDRSFAWLAPLLSGYGRPGKAGNKLKRMAEVLSRRDREDVYLDLLSHWKCPSSVVLGGDDVQTVLTEQDRWPAFDDYTHRMMYFDSLQYLPDDILTKVDRASMAVGLEARVPLLDHRVVEYCWRLPLSMKVRAGETKWALRQLIYRYLPREMVDRPKMGFGVPIEHWLRGPLREWAEALLDERRLREEGIFDPEPIRKCWLEYLSGTRSWPYHLWDVLVFQAWFEAQRVTTGSN